MRTNPFQIKVKKGRGGSTDVLIKSGDIVVHTEFSELVACDFPIHSPTPVHVEIPPSGAKSSCPGALTGSARQEISGEDYPHTVRFPVYLGQETASLRSYETFVADSAGQALTKVPVVALATSAYAVIDGKVMEVHCVLPIWNDGSTVLVRLVALAGDPMDSWPNPEWHMTASSGRPLAMGLELMEKVSAAPMEAERCRHELRVAPWRIGAQLLGEEGNATSHRIWQREWGFKSAREFSDALRRITGGLRGPALPEDAA